VDDILYISKCENRDICVEVFCSWYKTHCKQGMRALIYDEVSYMFIPKYIVKEIILDQEEYVNE